MTNSSTGSRQWLKFKLGGIVGAPAGAGPGPSRSALLGLRQGWAPGLPVSVPQSCSVRPRRWIFPDPRPLFLHLGLVLVKQSQRLPEKGHVVGTWQTPAPNAFAPRPRRWRQSPGRPPTPPRTAEASSQGLRLPTLRGSPPRHSDPRPGHGACWLSARGVSGPPCAAPRSGGPRGRRRPSLCFQQLRRDLQLRGCAVPSSRTLRGPPLFSGCSLPWQSRLPWSPRLSDLFEGVRDGFKFSPCTDSVRRNTVIFSVFPYFIIVTFTISKLKLKRTKIFRK